MTTEKKYTPEEIEAIAEKVSKEAMEHFKHGLNCSESVFKAFLDAGISDFPPETVALVSGMGGGMGGTGNTCGAVNAGMLVISAMKGRKNPYAKETMDERVEELHNPETGIYPIHGKYVNRAMEEYGTIGCRELCAPFDQSTPEGKKNRARNCKKIIGFCAKEATRIALTK